MATHMSVSRTAARATLAIFALGAWMLLAPASAQAKDEFERGFKDELGRITAHEAVNAGKHVVGAILYGGPHHGGHAPYGYGRYERHDGYAHVPPGHRKHWKHHHKRWKHHHRHRGHGYHAGYGYAPVRVVHHEHHHYHHGAPCASGYGPWAGYDD